MKAHFGVGKCLLPSRLIGINARHESGVDRIARCTCRPVPSGDRSRGLRSEVAADAEVARRIVADRARFAQLRAGEALGGKDPTGRCRWLRSGLAVVTEVAEHVVVAGGGFVGEDCRHQVCAREPSRREVDAAALAQARAAAVPRGPADGTIEGDETAVELEVRRALGGGPAVEDAAALAVAAVAANAACAASGGGPSRRRPRSCAPAERRRRSWASGACRR